MDLVFLVVNGVGMALDFLGFLLDVNFFLVSTLVSGLVWLITFIYNLPNALVAGVIHCWNGASLSLVYLVEALCCLVLGSVQTVTGLFRGFCSSLESLKVVGHLFSHMVLRSKELVHRGLWNLVGSGQSLLRQVCEVFTIVMSLLAYFVNSIINICLIGTQNLVLALWDSLISPFLRVTDLLAAFLAHMSSSAIAMSIVLWSPCQLAFELLESMSKLLVNIFFLNLYGLVLLVLVVTVCTLVLNPELTRTLANQVSAYLNTLPSYHRLRRDVWRLYQVVLLTLGMVVSSQAWRRVAGWSHQMANWNGGGRATNQQVNQAPHGAEVNQGRQGAAAAVHRPVAPGGAHQERQGLLAPNQQGAGGAHQVVQPAARGHGDQHDMNIEQGSHAQPASGRNATAGQRLQPPGEGPSTVRAKALRKEQLNASEEDSKDVAPENDLWILLKEQEERKKCVICQDQTKTVLLLPCRHLCLCQECTEILLQQSIYQRNCPLCRQMILQTLNVYL
ncbi:E3 ubiquitin-protein ligase RNF26 [Emydura macquarii macquarii]|uniref:E3 ubiquitin-protein ligase RNF26 n=1 Tax=Emydura macquarii macquarii TaxID=1129001 RepID=UPI00352ABBD6